MVIRFSQLARSSVLAFLWCQKVLRVRSLVKLVWQRWTTVTCHIFSKAFAFKWVQHMSCVLSGKKLIGFFLKLGWSTDLKPILRPDQVQQCIDAFIEVGKAKGVIWTDVQRIVWPHCQPSKIWKIWRAHDSMMELAYQIYQHIFLFRVLLGKNDTKSKRRGTDCVHLTQKNSLVRLSHQQRLGWSSADSYSLNVHAGHEVLLQISAQKKGLGCHNAKSMMDKSWWNSLSRSSPRTNWKWISHFSSPHFDSTSTQMAGTLGNTRRDDT